MGVCRQSGYRGFFGGSDRFAEEPCKSHRNALERSMKLELEANEVQFILNVLGEMPAKSGVWPLLLKIKDQADAQTTKDASTVQ
jgi:hypothetical protein